MVIKVGGSFLEHEKNIALLCEELAGLKTRFLLVHGGGTRISELSQKLGHAIHFHQGIRITSAEEMPLVDMVLAGEVNTHLVRAMRQVGVRAVGLTGADGLIEARRMFASSHTGYAESCNTELIDLLWQHRYVPVLASVASDEAFHGLNINADSLAEICARALHSKKLIFLTDVSGVYQDNEVIPQIQAAEIESLIARKTVQGGMIAKLRSVQETILKGVSSVHIGTLREKGDLDLLVQGRTGTHVH